MDELTTSDVADITDVVYSQGLSQTELRIFALKQDLDVAKVFIYIMLNRHGVDIMC